MAIVQETFEIPDDINFKILTGEFLRVGGIVRNAVGSHKGQIVKHLKPLNTSNTGQAQSFGENFLHHAKKNKKALLIVSAGTVLTAAAVGVYYTVKRHEPNELSEFRVSLRAYANAIRKGNLSIDEINNLMTSIEELRMHKSYAKISIKLSAEDLNTLVNWVYAYTEKLAQDNSINLENKDYGSGYMDDNTIINLRNHLITQKKIFEKVA